MILVDSSVLIDAFAGRRNEGVDKFREAIDSGVPFGINSVIYLEVLRGVRNEQEFQTVGDYLSVQKFYHLQDPIRSYEQAAQLYLQCRKHGVTPLTIDCLIAETAIEHHLHLLHRDEDFNRMAKIVPLKIY